MQAADETNQEIYTVSRLNNEVRLLLEENFPWIWVEGEISNFAAPHSGHWYFSLKDASAQVRCAMFRPKQRSLGFSPKDGMHVLIRAKVSLYPNRGDYQLIAEFIEERGEGKLRRAYEVLKKKLEEAGLFEPAHKKPLPTFPKQIGIITSATGAAIRDILTVLKRRFACVPIVIYSSLVQGDRAAKSLVNAIQIANQRKECDVLILARGGGSLEDLWPFNDEALAYAIYNSQVPIISGVGHEVDFTIADYVADKRAPTPSAAGEIVTPDKIEWEERLAQQKLQILRKMQNQLQTIKQHLSWMQKHLAQQHPKRRLIEKIQQLDFSEATLVQLQTRLFNHLQHKLKNIEIQLHHQTPLHRIHSLQTILSSAQQSFVRLMVREINKNKITLADAAAKLNALSPLATLQRGFALATKDERVIRATSEVKEGDLLKLTLMQGNLSCRVEKIH